MPQLRKRDPVQTQAVVPERPYIEYTVQRREDAWFIVYNGDEFGPYLSAREGMLFAVDVANKLGESGKDTRVVLMDTTGQPCSTGTYGVDSYPPRL
jgi:hypothetical protein